MTTGVRREEGVPQEEVCLGVAHLAVDHPQEPVNKRRVLKYMVTHRLVKRTKLVLSLLGVISQVTVGPLLRKKSPFRVLCPLKEVPRKWSLMKEVKRHS